jgi:transcriptional regulator with PAS, ATPase and Fis domain
MAAGKGPLDPERPDGPDGLDEEPEAHPSGPIDLDATTQEIVGQTKHALVRRFRLTVIDGPDAGAACSSTGERLVIGTHVSADFHLRDRTVSRFHCEIVLSDGRARLRDLGSRNGTAIDGVAVQQAFLRSGSLMSVGRTRVRFDLGPDHVRIRLSERERFGAMVGRSVAMRAAFALLERAAAGSSTVLLEGETGTGKEAAADAIHREGPRQDQPFIVVDCGAIPGELLESELFGHERGAFTGAVTARQGAFEAAAGGTLFLDEIGELSSDLQPKLLRALEGREVKRLGANHYTPVDVRVIAATNRNLRTEVNARKFRSDLYYRLAVLEVRLPPLRERVDDLPLLVEHILTGLEAADRPEAQALRTAEFFAELARHSWPGNVRELRNYIERCLALRVQTPLVTSITPAEPSAGAPLPWKRAREAFERQYLKDLLQRSDGNVTAAARAAGVDRIYFYRLLWRHGLR